MNSKLKHIVVMFMLILITLSSLPAVITVSADYSNSALEYRKPSDVDGLVVWVAHQGDTYLKDGEDGSQVNPSWDRGTTVLWNGKTADLSTALTSEDIAIAKEILNNIKDYNNYKSNRTKLETAKSNYETKHSTWETNKKAQEDAIKPEIAVFKAEAAYIDTANNWCLNYKYGYYDFDSWFKNGHSNTSFEDWFKAKYITETLEGDSTALDETASEYITARNTEKDNQKTKTDGYNAKKTEMDNAYNQEKAVYDKWADHVEETKADYEEQGRTNWASEGDHIAEEKWIEERIGPWTAENPEPTLDNEIKAQFGEGTTVTENSYPMECTCPGNYSACPTHSSYWSELNSYGFLAGTSGDMSSVITQVETNINNTETAINNHTIVDRFDPSGRSTIKELLSFLNDPNFELKRGSTGMYALRHFTSFFCLKAGQAIGKFHGYFWTDHTGIKQDLSTLLAFSGIGLLNSPVDENIVPGGPYWLNGEPPEYYDYLDDDLLREGSGKVYGTYGIDGLGGSSSTVSSSEALISGFSIADVVDDDLTGGFGGFISYGPSGGGKATSEHNRTRSVISNVRYWYDYTNIYHINNGFGTYDTNIFAYAAAYSEKYKSEHHGDNDNYANERAQLGIWGVVGDPTAESLGAGATGDGSENDVLKNTIKNESGSNSEVEQVDYAVGDTDGIKNSELWIIGKALDEYENAVTANLGGTPLQKHEAAVLDNDENLLSNPKVTINKNPISDESEVEGSSFTKANIGSGKEDTEHSEQDSTGATLYKDSSGVEYYKVGPFYMNNYTVLFANDEGTYANARNVPIDKYSGEGLEKPKMIGGIVAGKIILKNDSGATKTLNIGSGDSSAVRIVYSDMNGDATDKGTYGQTKTYTYIPDESQYEFPFPNSTFYVTIKKSDVEDYDILSKFSFKYRQTKANGQGFVVQSKYLITTFREQAENLQSGYYCPISYGWDCESKNPGYSSSPYHGNCTHHGYLSYRNWSHTVTTENGSYTCYHHEHWNATSKTHRDKQDGGWYICRHGHAVCYDTHWKVVAGPTPVAGQPFLAVRDAHVEVSEREKESEVNVRLRVNVRIDKHIYDVEHIESQVLTDSDLDTTLALGTNGAGEQNMVVDSSSDRSNHKTSEKLSNPVYVEYGDIVTYCVDLYNFSNQDVELRLVDYLPTNENCKLLSIDLYEGVAPNLGIKDPEFLAKEGDADIDLYADNVFRTNSWIKVPGAYPNGLKTTFVVKILVTSVKTGIKHENSAYIITNNKGYMNDDLHNTDVMRLANEDGPAPVVNIVLDRSKEVYDDSHYHASDEETTPMSADWYWLNDYNASIDKYISDYNYAMTTKNNSSIAENHYIKTTSEVFDENEIFDPDAPEGTKTTNKEYYTRYGYTEEEKENYPLAVEQTEEVTYSIAVTNDAVDVESSFPGASKPATQVRPTEVIDKIQKGLKLQKDRVVAVIYDSEGNEKEVFTPKIGLTVEESLVSGDDLDNYEAYKFKITKDVILNPGDYIIYNVPVIVEETNMYLFSLSNEGYLKTLTNINHEQETVVDVEGNTEEPERIIKDDTYPDENISAQETSKEFVRMKDLVIAGRVWLDRNKDGIMDYDESVGHLESGYAINVDSNPSGYIRYEKPDGSDYDYEKAMENIEVRLYQLEPGATEGTLIRTVKTNAEGIYSFGYADNTNNSWRTPNTFSIDRTDGALKATDSEQRIVKATEKDETTQKYSTASRLYEYYIEFKYDGILYKSTVKYSEADHLNDDGTFEDPAEKEVDYTRDSNAAEFKNIRDTFDAKHEIVGYNHAANGTNTNDVKLEYEKDGHNSYLRIDRDREMTARSFVKKEAAGVAEQSLENTKLLWLYKKIEGENNKYPATEYLKYINLGLEEREDVDISLTQDVYEVHDTVNGEEMRYWYNQNEFVHDDPTTSADHDTTVTDAFKAEYYMTGFTSDSSTITPYTFKYYASDYNYKVDDYNIESVKKYKGQESELDSEIYFRIHVTNNVIDDDEPNLEDGKKDIKVYTGINEIVEYFDEDFVDISYYAEDATEEHPAGTVKSIIVKTKNDDDYLINTEYKVADAYYVTTVGNKIPATLEYNTENEPKILAKESMYNKNYYANEEDNGFITTMKNNGYHTVYIRPNTDGVNKVILAEGENVDFIIKFTVAKDDTRNLKLGLKTAIAELSAYSTYYDENGVLAAGLVDKDSNAGNFGRSYTTSEITENSKTRPGYTESDDGDLKFTELKENEANSYLKVYEDDNFATGIKLEVQEEHERIIEGQVWDDARSIKAVKDGSATSVTASDDDGVPDDGVQYVGDGKNGTVSDELKKPALDEAKLNKNFENAEQERNDFVIDDVKVQLYEIIRVPVNGSGDIIVDGSTPIEERIYEDSILVNTDMKKANSGNIRSVMTMRTNNDGKYSLQGYMPGEYIVKFFYGDTVSDQMRIFNGQDYKSTTYQNGFGMKDKSGNDITDYADNSFLMTTNESGATVRATDKLGNPKKDTDKVLDILETAGLSDAKDDEIRRLETISYSETLNNNKTLILRGKDSVDEELQRDVTNMNAETIDFLVRAEKYKKDKTTLTYEETMEKVNSTAERHPIENIDFGLQYRPEQQVGLNKYIKNITVTTSDDNGAVKEELVNAKFNEFYGVVVRTNTDTGVTEFAGYESTRADGTTETVVFDVLEETGKTDLSEVTTADITTALNRRGISGVAKNPDGSYQVLIAGTKLDEKNSIGAKNLQYVPNELDSHDINSIQGFAYLNIDDEIMQGAEIKVEYMFTANNLSEVDRVNKNLSILRFRQNISDSELWYGGKKVDTVGSISFGGAAETTLKNYYDQDEQSNYNAVSIDSNRIVGSVSTVGSLITRKMEDDPSENKAYSGSLTARNALFNEYYHYELDAVTKEVKTYQNSIEATLCLDAGDDIIYRVKHKTIGGDTNDYYGRYLGSTYYTGRVGDNDIVAELKVDKILDYVDNNLVFKDSDNDSNTEDRHWSQATAEELVLGGYVQPTILSFEKEEVTGFLESLISIGDDTTAKLYSYDEITGSSVDAGTIKDMIKVIQRYSDSAKVKLYISKNEGLEVGALSQYQSLLGSGKLLDSNGVAYNTSERTNLALLQDERISDKQEYEKGVLANANITKYLSPRNANSSGSFGKVNILTSKIIAAEDDTKDMSYENVGEIVEYSSVTGRITNIGTTVGNVKLTENPDVGNANNSPEYKDSREESDTAAVEKVTLTPPTGRTRTQQIIQTVVKGASYTGVVLLIVAIVIGGTFGGITLYRKRRIK